MLNIKKYSFIIVAIFLVVFFIVLKINTKKNDLPLNIEQINNIKSIKIAGKSIKVELALTKESQTQGLSGRIQLKEGEGMLFVFDHLDKYYFWMKDMNFPIDIIWIDENLKVVYIKKNAKPELYPETYGGDMYAKYVLEVAAGFSDMNNLKEGDMAGFTF